ncbi:MAG: hypothetical protein HPY53_06870 [Brevinematales bacterium]|nr:hypothetical protein [Brevinematales bacterium]
MFGIAITGTNDVEIQRKDTNGNLYTILYRKDVDLRVYCPPHSTHRHGVNFDLGIYSDDGVGGVVESKPISYTILLDAANYYNFDIHDEANHYHLKYLPTRMYDIVYYPDFTW